MIPDRHTDFYLFVWLVSSMQLTDCIAKVSDRDLGIDTCSKWNDLDLDSLESIGLGLFSSQRYEWHVKKTRTQLWIWNREESWAAWIFFVSLLPPHPTPLPLPSPSSILEVDGQ